ncbi:sensor histidine kinase [Amycolatopsis suaedae]|uniref:histidine kinase n=1 Tax=Amycolatopsis suaedae TaxID=2510978 RepID=A0A4Q7J9E5_9PSEU|nr:histidine kinase [Amycolatopsis suaedae]RZQ64381.1 two-component sensor histidine kinase [Amycolatopsis suaedae]
MRDVSGSLRRQSLLIAAVCLVSDVSMYVLIGPPPDYWQTWVVLALLLAADAALALPPSTSGLVALLHAVLLAVTPPLLDAAPGAETSNNVGALLAGYRVGAWLDLWPALAALAAMLAGNVVGELIEQNLAGRDWRLLAAVTLGNVVMPWLVGRYTTARRAYIAELEQAAERRRQDEAAAVSRAVAEERSTIARDLHDVISHHVSAIGVHAGAARMGLAGAGTPAHESLSAVESASRSAMDDLRRLLDLLHGTGTGATRRQPGLDNIDELLDGVRRAGLAVTLRTTGRPAPLPGSLDVTLYRITQEALTNALRHGDGAVEVVLEYGDDEVGLTVVNPVAPGTTEAGTSRGLAGIRQRVALFGGQVTTGQSGRFWEVRVAFPVERS